MYILIPRSYELSRSVRLTWLFTPLSCWMSMYCHTIHAFVCFMMGLALPCLGLYHYSCISTELSAHSNSSARIFNQMGPGTAFKNWYLNLIPEPGTTWWNLVQPGYILVQWRLVRWCGFELLTHMWLRHLRQGGKGKEASVSSQFPSGQPRKVSKTYLQNPSEKG